MTLLSLQRPLFALGLCLCFILSSAVPRDVVAQDESEMLRKYPASEIAPNIVKIGQSQIEWQLKSLAMQRTSLESEIQQSRATIESIESTMEKMSKELPIETRFIDASSRSNIASQALEALLSAKLDLVVLDTQIAELETKKEKQPRTKQQEAAIMSAEISLKAAESELEKETTNLERTKKLFEKSYLPQREFEEAKFNQEIAGLKLQKARADLASAVEQPANSRSNELADLRLQAAPLQARIKAAESFLQKFVDANQGQARIDALKRQREHVIERTRWIEQRQFDLDMRISELNTLRKLVDESNTKKTDNANEDGKQS